MKTSALFIDLKSRIKKCLEEKISELYNKIEIFVVNESEMVYPILTRNEINIIFVDLDISNRNELQLLTKIKKDYSHIYIVAITEESSQYINDLFHFSHQIIAFPINLVKIENAISQFTRMTKYLHDGNLMGLINNIDELPTLPSTFMKIEKELSYKNVSLQRIGGIISESVTVTAKMIRIINSPFFGLKFRINDITQAVTLLGLNVIKSMILYDFLQSKKVIHKDYESYFEGLWTHSNQVGKFAEQIIYITNPQEVRMMEEAYISGLMLNIGKIVLLATEDYPRNILNYMKENKVRFSDAEYKLLGSSHSEVGAYFLALWGFPESCSETVLNHNHRERMDFSTFSVQNAVFIADLILKDPSMTIDKMKSLNLGMHPQDWVDYIESNILSNL